MFGGQQPQQTQLGGGGLFGGQNAQQPQQPQQQGLGGLFGAQQPQQPQQGAGGLFGAQQSQQPQQPQQPQQGAGGLFNAQQNQQQGGFLGGQSQQQPQQNSLGGGLFGATNTGLGMNQQTMPQQNTQQQQGPIIQINPNAPGTQCKQYFKSCKTIEKPQTNNANVAKWYINSWNHMPGCENKSILQLRLEDYMSMKQNNMQPQFTQVMQGYNQFVTGQSQTNNAPNILTNTTNPQQTGQINTMNRLGQNTAQ